MMLRIALVLLALAQPAMAQEHVVVGLSEDRVSITTDFEGSEIFVFGAVRRDAPPPEAPRLDVIVTVEGPRGPVDVRQKSRVAGIWINQDSGVIDAAPSFYAVAGTGPVDAILAADEDRRFRISIPRRVGQVVTMPGIADPPRFAEALVRLRSASGAYREGGEPVELAEDTLFSTSFQLPANLVEGAYEVRIFLLRGGHLIDAYSRQIEVSKVGLEQFLYALAHDYPMIYGALALVIAVVAGWGASAFFRLLRY